MDWTPPVKLKPCQRGARAAAVRSPPAGRNLLIFTAAIAAMSLAGAAFAAPTGAVPVNIIPTPLSVEAEAGAPVRIDAGTVIVASPNGAEHRIAVDFASLVARTRGLRLHLASRAAAGHSAILFRGVTLRGKTAAESYDLTIGQRQVVIAAATDAGQLYGAASLWQLMTPDAAKGPVTLQPTHIHDAPRFAWRGLMLDSARHYQSPAFIKKLIDVMALHKLNVLHWHLTDDQAWRLEIKKYPKLTQVGGWRVPAGAAAPADIDPKTGKPRLYGGVYTQTQVREIVAYAAARNITVVPEIEMPGHALSAILAYPELGSAGPAPASIQSDYGVFPWLYNTDDHTFAVLDDVLTEVLALFPSPYIHVGGDEAVKDQWKASPTIQAKMKSLGITSEDEMQSWFTHRIADFLTAHGRKLIGWDEILDNAPLPPGATVMSWRGIDGAIAAAKAGHDTVLAPAPWLYFDNRQSARPEEPPGRGAVIDLKTVYMFDPEPAALTDDQRRHIVGVQANVWTEHIRTEDRVETMLFPRVAAIAETAWSPQSARGWDGFANRVPAMLDRYKALGVKADDAAVAVRIAASPASAGQGQATLSTQFGLGEIRYTTDGSAPTMASMLYTAPLALPLPTHLKAAAFKDGAAISPVTAQVIDALTIRHRTSQQLNLCTNGLDLNLEDDGPIKGPRAAFLVDIMNPCWIYPKAEMTGIKSLSISVGQIPFNFQIGADRAKIALRPPHTPDGELEVRDGCTGPVIAALPLAAAVKTTGVTTLSASLAAPLTGPHDLCFSFTARSVDPISVVNWVQLTPADAGKPGA
jgi:hexosaminidase